MNNRGSKTEAFKGIKQMHIPHVKKKKEKIGTQFIQLKKDDLYSDYLNFNKNTLSIIAQHSNILKDDLNKLKSSATSHSLSGFDGCSNSFLTQPYFIRYLNDFVCVSRSTYWADKMILGVREESLRYFLFQAVFPQGNNYEKFIDDDDFVSNLTRNFISISEKIGLKPHMVLPLASIAKNLTYVFINTGTSIKNICWLPLHPDMADSDQYLALTADNVDSCKAKCCSIQIYRCSFKTTDKHVVHPPNLYLLLMHDWGPVTDLCWSPQPLPVVARTVPLIGHLAVACADGYVRILPLLKREGPPVVVKVTATHPVLCLGLGDPGDSNTHPTCLDWRPQHPEHLLVGYTSGQVALFVLEAAAPILVCDHIVLLRPTLVRPLLAVAVISVQLSPDRPSLVAVTGASPGSTLLVDLAGGPRIPPGVVLGPGATQLKWATSGRLLALGDGFLTVLGHPAGRQASPVPAREACLCPALGVMATATSGTVYTSWPQGGHTEVSHRYRMVSGGRSCRCRARPTCVHGCLPSQMSVMVSKGDGHEEDHPNSETESPIDITGIVANPNPVWGEWLAVSLRCGLVHLVPLLVTPLRPNVTTRSMADMQEGPSLTSRGTVSRRSDHVDIDNLCASISIGSRRNPKNKRSKPARAKVRHLPAILRMKRGQAGRPSEDLSLEDLSRIDDLSIVRSSPAKMPRITTVTATVPAPPIDPSPELLQPFHSLKLVRSRTQ